MKQNSEVKPVIRLSLTVQDRLLEIAGWLFLILQWLVVLYYYSGLPELIPAHFNIQGQPDDTGHKDMLFFLPAISLMLYTGMTILNRYPHIFNYPGKITPQNAERQYLIATRLIRYLKFLVVLTFFAITLSIILTAKNISTGLGSWFLPVFLMLIYIPLFAAIRKIFRAG